MRTTGKSELIQGMRDGFPIGRGYFAVSFSLGIAARGAGLTPFQGFLGSLLTNASAGEYAAFTLIGAGAAYFELFIMMLVTNARYFLMSCALSQRFAPETRFIHRLLIGFDITDELFGITIAHAPRVSPPYVYGAIAVSAPFWAVGTALGIAMGEILPLQIVSALSVALFGMFLAVIMPAARKDRAVAVLVTASFCISFLAAFMPVIKTFSSGTRTILLTLILSGAAALLHPVSNEEDGQHAA